MSDNDRRPPYGLNSNAISGVEDEIDGLFSRRAMRPKDFHATLHKLYDLVEEMQITTRDNNAILCQMLFESEKRMNDNIEKIRTEMYEAISRGGISTTSGPKVSTSDVKSSLGRYSKSSHPAAGCHSHIEPNVNKPLFEMVEITPLAGFVIKTRKLLGEKEKVFINIFHHEYIEVEPSEAARGPATDKPFMVMTQASSTVDKEGHTCLMFNLGVSSEYFKQPPNKELEISITAPSTIHKIIHKVNMKFNEFLDEGNYSLPRLANGFKGTEVPRFTVPVPVQSDSATVNTKTSKNSSGSDAEEMIAKGATAAIQSLNTPSNDHANGQKESAAELGPRRTSSISIGDDASVVSDISYDNTTQGNNRRSSRGGASVSSSVAGRSRGSMHRKSLFDISTMGYTGGDIAGRNLLSGDMLDYIVEENVDSTTAETLKAESAKDPSVLLGWQIWLQEHGHNSIYVVTDVRKNLVSKTEFRLSQFKKEDHWVLLKRAAHKSGTDFRPMRKVLYGLQVEDETTGGN